MTDISPIERFYVNVQRQLMAKFESDASSGPPIKGPNRETFVKNFLDRIFPRHIRFGSGILIDHQHQCSGQCDIVAELPFGPSLQIDEDASRYYFADMVAAVISVKSDLKSQWKQVGGEMDKLKIVDCTKNRNSSRFEGWGQQVPFFAVGYKGFQTIEEAKRHFDESGYDKSELAILSIESGVNVSGMDGQTYGHAGWQGLHCFIKDLIGSSTTKHMDPMLENYLISTPELF